MNTDLEFDLRLAQRPVPLVYGKHEHFIARIPPYFHVHLAQVNGHRQVLLPHRMHMLLNEYAPLVTLAIVLKVLVEGGGRITERYVGYLHVHLQQGVVLFDEALHDRYEEGVVALARLVQMLQHYLLHIGDEKTRLLVAVY